MNDERAINGALTWEQWREQWDVLLTEDEKQLVRDKAQWEHMSLWAVLNDWPSLRAEAVR